jgi:hypothetical protein
MSTPADASRALQAAVAVHLADDAALAALIGNPPRLFDEAPRGAAFPYVTLGDDRVSDWRGDGFTGSQHVLTLHAWSRAPGRDEVKAILGALRMALDDAALALEGHHLVLLHFVLADTERLADGHTLHGLARFRALTEPSV